jgi:hypothetical protein
MPLGISTTLLIALSWRRGLWAKLDHGAPFQLLAYLLGRCSGLAQDFGHRTRLPVEIPLDGKAKPPAELHQLRHVEAPDFALMDLSNTPANARVRVICC